MLVARHAYLMVARHVRLLVARHEGVGKASDAPLQKARGCARRWTGSCS